MSMNKALPIIAVLGLLFAACAGPPDKAIADAEKAVMEAAVVSDCAEGEFAEASKMLEEAKRLVEEGRYDEAEVKAKAAQKLAERAKKSGEIAWEDCQEEKRRLAAEANKKDAPEVLTLQTIYFNYNEAVLSDPSQEILRTNAEWLRRNPTASIIIQGHCDERGSTEYNLALGERRAAAVRTYLVQLGIEPGRLNILSYGEEMPANRGTTDDGHAKNRRAEFVPKAK
jgi:peptidoglycan-associated lipoprotein